MAVPVNLVLLLASFGLTSLFSVAIFRLWFHPLAKIPGPKVAALSRFYDFYHDCILGGKYAFKIQELHKLYGKSITHSLETSFSC